MSSFEERQMVEKNESRIDNLFALFERLNEREDPSEDVSLNTKRIEQLEAEVARLRDILQEESKTGKIEQIEQAALNKADTSMEGVVMTYKEIMAATGVVTPKHIATSKNSRGNMTASGIETIRRKHAV